MRRPRSWRRWAKAKNLANCVNHNLRCYPLVQQVRSMIEAGDLGDVLIVNGTYFQDWLLYDTDWNWRAQANENGALRAMGDIGSHWMDQIQHVTGLKITSLCADLQTFHHTRKKPKGAVETFTGKMLAPTITIRRRLRRTISERCWCGWAIARGGRSR
jgi:predicted dehydrogenase